MRSANNKKMRQAKKARNASEPFALFALYAVVAAIISPGGQAFSFQNFNSGVSQNGSHKDVLHELQKEYSEICAQLDDEKKRRKKLKHIMSLPIGRMNTDQLLVLKAALEDLKQRVHKQRAELLANTAEDPSISSNN